MEAQAEQAPMAKPSGSCVISSNWFEPRCFHPRWGFSRLLVVQPFVNFKGITWEQFLPPAANMQTQKLPLPFNWSKYTLIKTLDIKCVKQWMHWMHCRKKTQRPLGVARCFALWIDAAGGLCGVLQNWFASCEHNSSRLAKSGSIPHLCNDKRQDKAHIPHRRCCSGKTK